ncbi:MAG: hypothetical protein V7739_06345 [Motiliproteus sp.]
MSSIVPLQSTHHLVFQVPAAVHTVADVQTPEPRLSERPAMSLTQTSVSLSPEARALSGDGTETIPTEAKEVVFASRRSQMAMDLYTRIDETTEEMLDIGAEASTDEDSIGDTDRYVAGPAVIKRSEQ